jgi:hypothetical protein
VVLCRGRFDSSRGHQLQVVDSKRLKSPTHSVDRTAVTLLCGGLGTRGVRAAHGRVTSDSARIALACGLSRTISSTISRSVRPWPAATDGASRATVAIQVQTWARVGIQRSSVIRTDGRPAKRRSGDQACGVRGGARGGIRGANGGPCTRTSVKRTAEQIGLLGTTSVGPGSSARSTFS